MKIVIDIPEEQIKKSLEESKYTLEDEGVKGFINIMMSYTNRQLDFVVVSRKTDFYSCEYKMLPKGHGRLVDANNITFSHFFDAGDYAQAMRGIYEAKTIIEADKEE